VAEPTRNPDELGQSGSQGAAGDPAAGGAQQAPLSMDESRLVTVYSNFCRVTGTPEEVILDFALNSKPFETSPEPISVSQRIILTPMTAKRLIYALGMSVERHEATFGVLETNVGRRLRPTGPNQPQGAAAPF
jgi:hypothetical protein